MTENQSLYQLSTRQFGISEEVRIVEHRARNSFPLLQEHPLQVASEAKSQCHLSEEVGCTQLASPASITCHGAWWISPKQDIEGFMRLTYDEHSQGHEVNLSELRVPLIYMVCVFDTFVLAGRTRCFVDFRLLWGLITELARRHALLFCYHLILLLACFWSMVVLVHHRWCTFDWRLRSCAVNEQSHQADES